MGNDKRLVYIQDVYNKLEEETTAWLEAEPMSEETAEEDIARNTFVSYILAMVQHAYLVDVPSVDAVEVVRCKDCRFKTEPGQPNILCYNMKDDDFCSYGERKTENE